MNDDEINRRFKEDLGYQLPQLVDTESEKQNYTFKDMKFLYHQKGYKINDDMFEVNHNLLTKNNKYNMLAEILADKNTISLLFVRFEDNIKTEKSNRIEYGKQSLLVGIKELMQYVRDIINVPNIDLTGKRTTKYYFDQHAFEEGFLNAIKYHKWIDNRSYPRVFAFTDRIEIESAGGLPDGLSIEDFYSGKHQSVSKELTEVLLELDLIEHQGFGVPYIVKQYGRSAYNITDNFITLTTPYNFIDSRVAINVRDDASLEEKIISLIRADNKITRRKMAENLKVSEKTIERCLDGSTKIRREGSKKTGHWVIK